MGRFTRWPVRPTTAPARAARCRSRSWHPLRTTRAPEVRSWAIARPMNGAAEHLLDSRLGPGATRNDNRYSVAGRCCGCDARHYRHRLRSRAAAGFGQTADICGWRQHERCYFASTQELFGRAAPHRLERAAGLVIVRPSTTASRGQSLEPLVAVAAAPCARASARRPAWPCGGRVPPSVSAAPRWRAGHCAGRVRSELSI